MGAFGERPNPKRAHSCPHRISNDARTTIRRLHHLVARREEADVGDGGVLEQLELPLGLTEQHLHPNDVRLGHLDVLPEAQPDLVRGAQAPLAAGALFLGQAEKVLVDTKDLLSELS